MLISSNINAREQQSLFTFFARPRITIPIPTITHNPNDPFQLLRKTHFFTHDNMSYCFGTAGAVAAPTHSGIAPHLTVQAQQQQQ